MQDDYTTPPQDSTALVKLNDAVRMLSEVRTIQDAQKIIGLAEAARTYAQQARLGLEAQNHGSEIKLRAERLAGQILAESDIRPGRRWDNCESTSTIIPPTLAELGIDRHQSSRWQKEAAIPDDIFEQHIAEVKAAGEKVTAAGVSRLIKEHAQANIVAAALENPPIPTGRYSVIYADPPWDYEFSRSESRSVGNHYPTMTIEELADVPVPSLAEKDAVLFLWATSPKLSVSLNLMDCWGFDYRTCMVWVKDRIGMGYYARQQHEILLIGKRGEPALPLESDRPSSVVNAPRGEHSAKPEVFYEIIERMYPGRSYLELFARSRRDGWISWGNQIG
jgi:N6-adenosine-specific RNA methylase IME4